MMGETVAEYVERRLHQIFVEVAERVGCGDLSAGMQPEDVTADHLDLFQADLAMRTAWRGWLARCWEEGSGEVWNGGV